MDLRNCPRCGKLFAYKGTSKICPVCLKNEDDEFTIVKEYLWDHPNATIEVVHEETGVDRETIIKFVKQGRLNSEGLDFSIMVECERCGTPISGGRFCLKCQGELIKGFSSGKTKSEEPEKEKKAQKDDKMYTANRIKKKSKSD